MTDGPDHPAQDADAETPPRDSQAGDSPSDSSSPPPPSSSPQPPASGLYQRLIEALDIARYVPELTEGIVTRRLETGRGAVYYVVKNGERAQYLRLSEKDFRIFEKIDGQRSIKNLVLLYFKETGTFGFRRVATLVEQLKQREFLSGRSSLIFTQIKERASRRGLVGRLSGLADSLLRREFALRNLDGFVKRMYQRFFWPFFTRTALIIYALVALIGTGCFAHVLNSGRYDILQVDDSYLLGFIVFLLLDVFVILLHEGSHAFAVVACKRDVVRGGFMMYLGMPAFFVDTSDIWMENRPKRIAVSAAGPISELVMGSAVGLFMVLFPACPINWLLFKIAFLFYLGVIVNMNPLLELDGYYILMDLVEIPNLRKRSLAFVRNKLWGKLTRREAFTRREIVYTVFGTLAGAYTVFVILVTLYLYETRLKQALQSLYAKGDLGSRILLALFFFGIVVPLAAAILMRLARMAKALWKAAARMGLFDTQENVTLVLLGAIMLAAFLIGRSNVSQFEALTVAAAALAAIGALTLALQPRLPRVILGMSTRWVLAFFIATFVAEVGARLATGRSGLMHETTACAIAFFAGACANLALLAALLSGFFTARTLRLRYPLNLACVIVALSIALHVGWPWVQHWAGSVMTSSTPGPYLASLDGAPAGWMAPHVSLDVLVIHIAAVATYASAAIAVAALAIFLFFWAFSGTRMSMAASLLVLATLLLAVQRIHYFHLWLLAASPVELVTFCATRRPQGFLLVTAPLALFTVAIINALHVRALRVAPTNRRDGFLSDADRLVFAFESLAAHLLEAVRLTLGSGAAKALARLACDQAHNSAVRHDGATMKLAPERPLPFGVLGDAAKNALDVLRARTAAAIGRDDTREAFSYAFDTLPWDVREVAADVFLEDTADRDRHSSARRTYEATLAANPILSGLTPEERAELLAVLEVIEIKRDTRIIREGDRGDKFYVIQEGAVEVLKRRADGRERVVATLRPPEYFGEVALLEDTPRTASCRALAGATLLAIAREDFQRLIAGHFEAVCSIGRAAELTHLLRNMPLFAEFEPAHMHAVMRAFTLRETADGECVIRQGEPGDSFYVILSGCFEVLVSAGGKPPVKVAELRRGEYFGEIALLEDVPRTATVRARGDGTLLALSRNDFGNLIKETILSSEGLSRATSRRRLDTRRKSVLS